MHTFSALYKSSRGFTLVELLISVAIISILTSIVMLNFIGVRQRARDAQRKADIRQMQAALEMYRADQGAYPSTLPSCKNAFTSPDGTVVYMSTIPCDPLYPNYYSSGNYSYSSQGGGYSLIACLENTNDAQGQKQTSWGGNCTTQFFFVGQNP